MTIKGITRTGGLIATVAATLLAAGAALAQSGDPVTVPVGAVEGGALRGLDLWSAPGSDTGLSPELWRDASPALATLALNPLGERPLSPAMRALAIRALETGARAPAGSGEDEALATLRVRALLRLGRVEAVESILARTPGVEMSEALTRLRAEAAMARGDIASACAAGDALRVDRDAGWQLKLRAWCQLSRGEAAAQLAYDLWARREETDAAFSQAFAAALGGGEADPLAAFGLTAPEPAPTPKVARIDLSQVPSLISLGAAERDRAERLRLQSAALLAAALREDLNPDARATLASFDVPAPRATFARLQGLDAAADGDRPGEVVLYALSIAHQQPQGLGVAERVAIVRALARVGLTEDAVRIAAEGLADLLPPEPEPEPDPAAEDALMPDATATQDPAASIFQ